MSTAGSVTITVILEPVDRHGNSQASLPDGTIPVESSRQPFLEAARVLMAAGQSPGSWLEGRRPGSPTWALRAHLGIAAGLTVDESKTFFAKWKPFSRSAVSPLIRASEKAAPDSPPLQSPAVAADCALAHTECRRGAFSSPLNKGAAHGRDRPS